MFNALLDALSARETYQLTDHHWTLVYEAIRGAVEPINMYQQPRLWQVEDRHSLKVRRHWERRPRVRVDLNAPLEVYVWDLGFLLSAACDGLTPDQNRMLDANPELVGVIRGLQPMPGELRPTSVPP